MWDEIDVVIMRLLSPGPLQSTRKILPSNRQHLMLNYYSERANGPVAACQKLLKFNSALAKAGTTRRVAILSSIQPVARVPTQIQSISHSEPKRNFTSCSAPARMCVSLSDF